MTKRLLYSLLLIVITNYPARTGVFRPYYAKHAMIASADKHATNAGLDVLKKGGNAIDAAVAVGFTLAVTYPQAGNIGGGGFMLIRFAGGPTLFLDYREKAPEDADRDMYLYPDGSVIPDASVLGYRASGVPGTVHGLYNAHQRYGRLPWSELIQYAVDYAENGFKLNRYMASSLYNNLDKFLRFESTARIFTRNKQSFSEGDTLIQTALAATLKLIQKWGSDGFYTGHTAQIIASEMQKNGGLITEKDLQNYRSVWRDPIQFDYRGFTITSVAPPSSGGVILSEILNGVEPVNLQALGHNSSDLIHLWVEIEKQAYRDRSEYLGDPDFVAAPIENLISDEYGRNLFSNINPYYAKTVDAQHRSTFDHQETTHFSIVDSEGNAVSNTYTLNGSYGSGVVIDGTGILLNNEMDDFSIKSGYPNIYGLIGNEANEIRPGKRMLSSMTPTIVARNDSLFMIIGSPGGATIITTVAQVISNVIDHQMNIRQAIEAPRFHHQWLPDSIKIEQTGFSKDVLRALNRRGHQYQQVKSIGDAHGILRRKSNKSWSGWSDPRGNGICKGY